MLLNQDRFAQRTARHSAEMPRFAAKRGFIHEASEQGDGRTSLESAFPKRSSVQFSSVTQSCPTLCNSIDCSTPGFSVHHQLPEFTQTHVHRVSDEPSSHLVFYRPLLLLPSVFPSITVFSSESVLRIRWPKSWSFSFSISPPKEYSGLISFRIVWIDLLAVQGTLKSLLHHHSLKTSILGAQFSLWYNSQTSIHGCWKNHSFDYTDFCHQSDVFIF